MFGGFSSSGLRDRERESELTEGLMDRGVNRSKEINGFIANPTSSSSILGVNYIEHRVTKMDTLAGVAIKYGVEVADIRRLNGLVTDLQMFAYKSLQIPLPGRHPPSPILPNGSETNGYHSISDSRERTPPHRPNNNLLDSFHSLKPELSQGRVSPAMSSLQGYYGLACPKIASKPEGTEMAVYPKRESVVSVTDLKPSGEDSTGDAERSIRRRQKADADLTSRASESVQKDEMFAGLSGRAGKSPAPRPKNGSRTDVDVTIGDPFFVVDGLASVRKSSSASNLQQSENGSLIWSSNRWTLKPDVIAREIFDGLPKPMTIRRTKAALD